MSCDGSAPFLMLGPEAQSQAACQSTGTKGSESNALMEINIPRPSEDHDRSRMTRSLNANSTAGRRRP
jgi:hypothetical protein